MMKAYETISATVRMWLYDADHYQALSHDWWNTASLDTIAEDQAIATYWYGVARYKMGIRESDYDWENAL